MYIVYIYAIIKFILDYRDALEYIPSFFRFVRFALTSAISIGRCAVALSDGWVSIEEQDYLPAEGEGRVKGRDIGLDIGLVKGRDNGLDLGLGLDIGRDMGLDLTHLSHGSGHGLSKSGQIGGQDGLTSSGQSVQQPKSPKRL
ncbi:MAG: hypothetical protein K0U52_09090 [Gammaproteobacteria bacterium]|nr:hypothetical protein [Gammaproteobacteria bacterium]